MKNNNINVDECVAELESISDGTHDGTICTVAIEPIETGGDVVTLTLNIEYKGIMQDVEKKYYVISDAAREFLLKEMKKLEFEIGSRQDFLALREKLVGVRARWKALTNKDGFQCWYVVERIEGADEQPKKFVW